MFPNMDQTINAALAEHGFTPDGRPPGYQGSAGFSSNPQAAAMAPVQATPGGGLNRAAMTTGALAAKIAGSPMAQKAKNAAPILLGGIVAGAVAAGAIYLARRMEHGPAKKDETHLRLDAATIGPIIAAVLVGALVFWIVKKIRELNDAVAMAELTASVQPTTPGFSPTAPMTQDPIDQELAAASALMSGIV